MTLQNISTKLQNYKKKLMDLWRLFLGVLNQIIQRCSKMVQSGHNSGLIAAPDRRLDPRADQGNRLAAARVRAGLTGLRKKGREIARSKDNRGVTRYCVVAQTQS